MINLIRCSSTFETPSPSPSTQTFNNMHCLLPLRRQVEGAASWTSHSELLLLWGTILINQLPQQHSINHENPYVWHSCGAVDREIWEKFCLYQLVWSNIPSTSINLNSGGFTLGHLLLTYLNCSIVRQRGRGAFYQLGLNYTVHSCWEWGSCSSECVSSVCIFCAVD